MTSTPIEELPALSESVMVVHDGAASARPPRSACDRDGLLATPISESAGREQIATS